MVNSFGFAITSSNAFQSDMVGDLKGVIYNGQFKISCYRPNDYTTVVKDEPYLSFY